MDRRHTRHIPNLLVRIRNAKHLSQSSFIDVAYSQGMLSKVENGSVAPTFTKIILLLNHMNISLSEFEFHLLENQWTKENQFQQKVDDFIDNYQFYLLTPYFEDKKQIASYPHLSQFQHWATYCFGLSFKNSKKQDYTYMINLLNQDEFFNNDYKKIIYGLPSLELEAAFYNYNRIQDQLQHHQIGTLKPYILIDAAITMANIFLVNEKKTDAYHYFYFGLQQAKKNEDIHRIIVCSIYLFFLSQKQYFLEDIHLLKTYFSKDIFYEYWYNVLYNKFNEV